MNLISIRRLLLSTAIVSSFAVAAIAATINGSEGDDTIYGTASNDIIDAKAGNDIVHAKDGNDYVIGGLGGGELDGEAGADIIVVGQMTGLGGSLVEGQDSSAVVEVLGGDGDDFIVLGETLLAGSNADCGPGTDRIYLGNAFHSWQPRRTVDEFKLIKNCEQWHFSPLGSQDVIAQHPVNQGGQILFGSPGYDHWSNIYIFDENVAGISNRLAVYFPNLVDTRFVDASAVTQRGIEFRPNSIGTLSVQTDVKGSQASDIYFGTFSPDRFKGNGGDDYYDGGDGTDNAIYSGNFSDYTIAELTYNTFTVTDNRTGSPDGTDTIVDVNKLQFADQTVDVVIRGMYIVGDDTNEEFTGGNQSDFLDGAGGDDSIAGDGGNDTEVGGSGDDNMEGGPGNDFVYGDEQPDLTTTSQVSSAVRSVGSDTINYSKARAAITVNLKTGKANSIAAGDPAKIGVDTLKGIENIKSGPFSDILRGSSAKNLIDGGKGRDIVIMSGKKRQYTVTYNSKTKTYLVVDKVAGRDGTDTLKNVEVIRFTDGDQVTMSLSSSASID